MAIEGSLGYPKKEEEGESALRRKRLQLVEGLISPFQGADKTAFSKEIRREIQFRISHTLTFYEIKVLRWSVIEKSTMTKLGSLSFPKEHKARLEEEKGKLPQQISFHELHFRFVADNWPNILVLSCNICLFYICLYIFSVLPHVQKRNFVIEKNGKKMHNTFYE